VLRGSTTHILFYPAFVYVAVQLPSGCRTADRLICPGCEEAQFQCFLPPPPPATSRWLLVETVDQDSTVSLVMEIVASTLICFPAVLVFAPHLGRYP
jgi:hypothetical protein